MNQKDDNRQRKQTAQERPPVPSIDTQDPVDEASYDSFPASDPPSHTGTRAKPGAEEKSGKTKH
jgi:hypothetical protein